ncbi:MAG: hypothetical protein JW753_01970 [Dehalococcoidia bacterium]|nr:hypothetical protein [Dehalococcoidia bacterium]
MTPFISTIIARVLAITDYFLAQWVDVAAVSNASPNGCWEFDVQNATLNACGQEFIANLTDVVEGVIALVPSLLGGLFAFGTPEAV